MSAKKKRANPKRATKRAKGKRTKGSKLSAKKTPDETPDAEQSRPRGEKGSPEHPLIPQMRGGVRSGAIYQGAPANPRAGPGRPRSATRDAMHEALASRVPILEAIADGDVVQRIAVPLASVLPHVRCPVCEGKLTLQHAGDILIGIEGRVSASPRDRTGALKLMADVGIGPAKAVSLDVLREKLKAQNAIIRKELGLAAANKLLRLMGAVWTQGRE